MNRAKSNAAINLLRDARRELVADAWMARVRFRAINCGDETLRAWEIGFRRGILAAIRVLRRQERSARDIQGWVFERGILTGGLS